MPGTFDSSAVTRLLADLYPDEASILRILEFAQIRAAFINFTGVPINTWHSVIREASQRGRLADVIKVVILEHPDNVTLHEALRDTVGVSAAAPAYGSGIDAINVEKLMGAQSTLLPIAFLETARARASAVVRVRTPSGPGTGFVIADDAIVTNHHVIPSADVARRTVVDFNYEARPDGSLTEYETYDLFPDRLFVTSPKDDLTVVATSHGASLSFAHIDLPSRIQVPRRVNIIQHPGGADKQIALYHNTVTHADDSIIQYYTDTLPGSSGSPLFNDDWELVGVHRAGGSLYSPATKSHLYCNEGTALARLRALLQL
jgi:V8-like Glu-specific endopeptidase